jgi:hypothetical protein
LERVVTKNVEYDNCRTPRNLNFVGVVAFNGLCRSSIERTPSKLVQKQIVQQRTIYQIKLGFNLLLLELYLIMSLAEVPRKRMKHNTVETQALSLDTLPVDLIAPMLHFLGVSDWFHFSLASKRCRQLHRRARMPKVAVINIQQTLRLDSFIRKVARWNTIFTEETGHLRIHNIGYVRDSISTVDLIERIIAQEGFQVTGVSSLDISSYAGGSIVYPKDSVLRGLALMFPNLKKLNMSGVSATNWRSLLWRVMS